MGALLIAHGEGDRLADDVREFVGDARTLRRLALIHVLHMAGGPSALAARRESWLKYLRELSARGVEPFGVSVDVLPLDEELGPVDTGRWGRGLGSLVLFRGFWAEQAMKPPGPSLSAVVTPSYDPRAGATVRGLAPDETVDAALDAWLKTADRLLWLAPPESLPVDGTGLYALLGALARPQVTDVAAVDVSSAFQDKDARAAAGWALRGALGGSFGYTPELVDVAGPWIDRRALLLLLHTATQTESPLTPDGFRRALGDKGRGLLVSHQLPPELADLGVTQVVPKPPA